VRTGDVVDGRFRLEDAKGSGSGGIVWTAFDTKLKRTVALKRPHGVITEADRVQFAREAEIAAQVHHPNLIAVFDAVDGWLVMEHLESASLDVVLADGPLPLDRVARIGMQIAAALAAVHERGIVHRDVKPGNILVAANDLAKLTDFGISVWREVTGFDDARVSGTPAYTAPEVAAGYPAGPESDVFSLGATLYTALEGAPPFGTGEPKEVLERVRTTEFPPLKGPLADLLTQMLDRRRKKRPTAEQVREKLREIVGGWEPPSPARKSTPIRRRRSYQLAGAVLAVIALAVGVFVASQPPPAIGADLIGEEHTADPCALMGQNVFRAFGPPELRTDYGNFNRCDVLIDVRREKKIDVEIQLVTKVSQQIDESWQLVPDTPFSLYVIPSDEAECNRLVNVDDRYGVRVTAKIANPPDNLCAIADTAVETVKEVLRRGQIPRRTKRFSEGSAAWINTCGLLPAEALPGFNPPVDVFAGWSCKWFSPRDRRMVQVRYDQHPLTDSIKGRFTTLGGYDAYVQSDTGTSRACTAQVPYLPPSGARRTTLDVMMVTAEGDPGEIDLCQEAERLATVAARNLHR
jgi:hypothetical protein